MWFRDDSAGLMLGLTADTLILMVFSDLDDPVIAVYGNSFLPVPGVVRGMASTALIYCVLCLAVLCGALLRAS